MIWGVVPQPTEWQHIGNKIKAAFVVARTAFVNVGVLHWWLVSRTAATA
jgi:hypothetical protein